MSTVHRRVLTAKDVRCSPSPSCPLQDGCARFKSPMPQGIGAKLENYRSNVSTTAGVSLCLHYLSFMVSDEDMALEREVAELTKKKAWPFPRAAIDTPRKR